ncbi:hypothetical protein TUBRATIS_003740 [Tubulinosema ratisbonensis]|uniref:Uncharacterized protein n=1 Tax=Tubulinosema ratisbonensis TaxID=291195 RepID=A0A437APM5_9MICR|nr:hypothetical protein TUBRATIS_003740 [Tubulinosema ratisbonensis]
MLNTKYFIGVLVISLILFLIILIIKIKRRLKLREITNLLPLCISSFGPELKESLVLKRRQKLTKLLINYLNTPTRNNTYQISKYVYRKMYDNSLTLPSEITSIIMKGILYEQTEKDFFRRVEFSFNELVYLRDKAPFLFYYCILKKEFLVYSVDWLIFDISKETEQILKNLTTYSEQFIMSNKSIIFFRRAQKYSLDIYNLFKNSDLRSVILKQPIGFLLFGSRKIFNLEKFLLKKENFDKSSQFLSLAVIKNK